MLKLQYRWGAPHMAPCVPMGVSGGPRASLWGSMGVPVCPYGGPMGLSLQYLCQPLGGASHCPMGVNGVHTFIPMGVLDVLSLQYRWEPLGGAPQSPTFSLSPHYSP